MGETPWRGDPGFVESGRPHVSDMHALLHLVKAGLVVSGEPGCGTLGAENMFLHAPSRVRHGHPCATCKSSGGGPIAVHFSHHALEKLAHAAAKHRIRRRLVLECLRAESGAEYVYSNHQRAACLVEASVALVRVCASVHQHGAAGVAVREGAPCHAQCGGHAGFCPAVCGEGGACCRRGFADSAELAECGFGALGTASGGHVCVVADPRAREGQPCHEQCGGHAGFCPEYCGKGGACCRVGSRHDGKGSSEVRECDNGRLGVEGKGHVCVQGHVA
jgi:hypothetical protein